MGIGDGQTINSLDKGDAAKPSTASGKMIAEILSERPLPVPLKTAVDQASVAPTPKQSYLDRAVHTVVDPVATTFLSGERAKSVSDEATYYSKAFIKTAPLFMRGPAALGGLALAYASDEAKIGDTVSNQIIDAGLGIGKAGALKASFAVAHTYGLTPAWTGIGLGITGRAAETWLTRDNYYDQTGRFNLQSGLLKTAETTFDPKRLAMDAATGAFMDVAWGKMYARSRGTIQYDIVKAQTIAGATMGLASGGGNEAIRQWESGEKFDPLKIVGRGVMQAGVDGLAARVGGKQFERTTRLPGQDAPDAVQRARETPYQKGEIVDAKQKVLRDGEFTVLSEVKGLTTETFRGSIANGDGTHTQVLFRPDNGTEAFAHRMQSEIATYGLSQKLGSSSVPAAVARTIEIDGKTYTGYMQEMRGQNLLESLTDPRGRKNREIGKEALTAMRSDKVFADKFQDAFGERMIYGEWDNHALNFTATRKARGDAETTVNNIDMGDGLKPAQSTRDFKPSPGFRYGYDNVNSALYGEIAGKPMSDATLQRLNKFLDSYDTPAGKSDLQSLGLTGQQVEGVIGRARWFANGGVMPREMQPYAYKYFVKAVKSALGRNKHATYNPPLEQTAD